jgi:hypothetical protein
MFSAVGAMFQIDVENGVYVFHRRNKL